MLQRYEDCEYDYQHHRWVLTPAAITEYADTNPFGNEVRTRRVLRSISDTVYDYIYSANRNNRRYFEYVMACKKQASDAIVEALRAQLEAHIASGINDIERQSGFNIKTGKAPNPTLLASATICVRAKQAIQACPYNLMYAGDVYLLNGLGEDRYKRYGY